MTFIYLILSLALAQNSTLGSCALSSQEKTLITRCLQQNEDSNCSELKGNPEFTAKLSSCHVNELNQSIASESFDIIKGCGQGVGEHLYNGFASLKHIPSALGQLNDRIKQARQVAAAICTQRLETAPAQQIVLIENAKSKSDRDYNKLTNAQIELNRIKSGCEDKEFVRIRDVKVDWDQYKKAFDELVLKAHCFQPQYKAEVLCPVAAEIGTMFFGGALLSSGKELVNMSLNGLKKLRFETSENLNKIHMKVKKGTPAELGSALHQEDLIALGRNPGLTGKLKSAAFDMKALERGMIDSDKGKLSFYKDQFVNGSPESREFIRTLQGQGNLPADKALREALEEAGFKNKSLLPSHLNPGQIEEVFKNAGAMPGYLHELPGLREAIAELNQGQLTKAEFKSRLRANLFHNGPDEGFWKFFGENGVPGSLKASNLEQSKSFFKGTVFENPSGDLTRPIYPGPTSAEAFLHTMADRLSQGTRGGINKIFDEIGGKAILDNPKIKLGDINIFGSNGLQTYSKNLLAKNQADTITQLNKLKDLSNKSQFISVEQKNLLDGLIKKSTERVEKAAKFYQDNIRYIPSADNPEKMILSVTEKNGNKLEHVLTKDTPLDRARLLIDGFLLAEEKAHGHPFKNFTSENPAKKLAGSAAIIIPAAITCKSPSQSKTGSEERNHSGTETSR